MNETEYAMRHNEIGDGLIAAIVNLDVAIDLLSTPRTDFEMTVNDELQHLNRQLTIIATSLGIDLTSIENG